MIAGLSERRRAAPLRIACAACVHGWPPGSRRRATRPRAGSQARPWRRIS